MSALTTLASSQTFVALVVSAALKGSLLLLTALLLDLALRRHTAALRHGVWTAAFGALLLVPLAAPLAPEWSLPLLPARLVPSAEAGGGALDAAATRPSRTVRPHKAAESAPAIGRSATDAAAASDDAADPASMPDGADLLSMLDNIDATPVRAASISWAALVIAAWIAGAILLLAQLGIAAARASRLCRRARKVDDPAWNDLLERARRRLDLRVPVRLVCSDAVQSPMAWGVRHHHVVLPTGAERWTDERREVVLLHELAHVRRADCLLHLLSGVVAALYWPHPLVWIARRRQVAERELACDDTVLASGARGADYAWHLLEIARTSGSSPSVAPVGVTMARRSQLEGRLLAALDGSRDRRHLSRFGAAMPTVAGLLMAVALAGLQPWATAQEPAGAEQEAAGAEHNVASAEQEAGSTAQEATARQRTAQAPAVPQPASQATAAEGLPAHDRVLQMFVGLLDDPDVSIRRQAVASLGRMEDAAAVPALSEAMVDNDDAGVRAQAAWALGMIESADAVAALGQALSDADANVRAKAAWALGMIESAEAVASLATTLRQDADPSVRKEAAWALGMIEDDAGLEALIDAVEDQNAAVRKQALWSIGQIVG